MPIRIDTSELPLLVVTFEGAPSDEEFDAYLAEVSTVLSTRRQWTATVLDARHSRVTTASQRRSQAEWLRANADLLRRHSAGTAFVIESPVVRGVLTAILWLQPMDTPHIVVPTMSLARVWAKDRLRERGVAI